MAAATETETPTPKADSLQKLKARKVHKGITLPSGAVVDIQLPSLPQLVKSGTIPSDLLESALKQQTKKPGDTLTEDDLRETWDFTRFIVPKTVVKPSLTEDDVEDLAAADVEMIANFASRRIDMDAVGHQLGGLETQEAFRKFRDLDGLSSLLGDV